jgi:hypothetical protein
LFCGARLPAGSAVMPETPLALSGIFHPAAPDRDNAQARFLDDCATPKLPSSEF